MAASLEVLHKLVFLKAVDIAGNCKIQFIQCNVSFYDLHNHAYFRCQMTAYQILSSWDNYLQLKLLKITATGKWKHIRHACTIYNGQQNKRHLFLYKRSRMLRSFMLQNCKLLSLKTNSRHLFLPQTEPKVTLIQGFKIKSIGLTFKSFFDLVTSRSWHIFVRWIKKI